MLKNLGFIPSCGIEPRRNTLGLHLFFSDMWSRMSSQQYWHGTGKARDEYGASVR